MVVDRNTFEESPQNPEGADIEVPTEGAPESIEPKGEPADETSGDIANSDPAKPVSPTEPESSKAELDRSKIPGEILDAIDYFSASLNMPVWSLVQFGAMYDQSVQKHSTMDESVFETFFEARGLLPADRPIGLFVDSPGGSPDFTYKLARMLQRHKGYVVIIPRYAKSAATLLALGALRIIMGPNAELGPLDMQVQDHDREDFGSALSVVQALDRIKAGALEDAFFAMEQLRRRTGKKLDTLIPVSLRYGAELSRPLLERVDLFTYTQRSRQLDIVEEYACRLLRIGYGKGQAAAIANALVRDYPAHGFVVDPEEAASVGLKIVVPTEPEARDHLERAHEYMNGKRRLIIVGPLPFQPATPAEPTPSEEDQHHESEDDPTG